MGPYAGGPACVGAPTRHVHCRCTGSIGCRNAIVDAQDNPIPMLMIRRHLFSPDTPPAATSLIAGASELRTHRSRIHASLFIAAGALPTRGLRSIQRNGPRSEEHTSELQSLMSISYD